MGNEEPTRVVKTGQFLGHLLDRITNGFLVAAGAMIFIMAVVTTYGVIRRYLFHSPDNNAYLFTCILMLGCAIFALAHIQRLGKNITVDYLSQRLPRRVRGFVINVVGPVLGLVFCVPLVWKSWENAWFAMETGQRTITILRIPTFPMQMAIPVCAGLLCLVLIAQMLRYFFSLRSRESQVEQ
jgi:TRAP-type C4-dicarboxylate transport system permease small subunit